MSVLEGFVVHSSLNVMLGYTTLNEKIQSAFAPHLSETLLLPS